MSCGKCNFNSKGEYEIKQLLDTWNINYKHDINFSELTEQTGRKLRFDFIIYDKNFEKPIRFIEFDGRQHILGPEAIWSNSDPLEKIQERDKIKNDFCLKNNYQLIRIPYTKLGNITIFDLLEDTFLVSKGE